MFLQTRFLPPPSSQALRTGFVGVGVLGPVGEGIKKSEAKVLIQLAISQWEQLRLPMSLKRQHVLEDSSSFWHLEASFSPYPFNLEMITFLWQTVNEKNADSPRAKKTHFLAKIWCNPQRKRVPWRKWDAFLGNKQLSYFVISNKWIDQICLNIMWFQSSRQ